jgi:hypothetical protein
VIVRHATYGDLEAMSEAKHAACIAAWAHILPAETLERLPWPERRDGVRSFMHPACVPYREAPSVHGGLARRTRAAHERPDPNRTRRIYEKRRVVRIGLA